MKDPTSGPMAVTAVVLMLLLKYAALTTLLPAAPAALWLAPLLARTAVVAAFASTPYVRAGGLGSALAGASRTVCVLAVAAAVGLPAWRALHVRRWPAGSLRWCLRCGGAPACNGSAA